MHGYVVAGGRSDEVEVRRRRQETLTAWEHFVKGDDEAAVSTVAPMILHSWYRCRDLHRLDPVKPKTSTCSQGGDSAHASRHAGVYALLGAVAGAIVEGVGNCVATVTDSGAQIVAARTVDGLRREVAECRLEPEARWPESLSGTNGMGTALLQSQQEAAVVRGPEHWRQDMHEWTCLGIAVHDPVTASPVGVLNVSAHTEMLIAGLGPKLNAELGIVRQYLIRCAFRDAIAVAEKFTEEAIERRGKLLGLDLAGNVIAASEDARKYITGLPRGFLLEPTTRRGASFGPLRDIAAASYEPAVSDPGWSGTAVIGRLLGDPQAYSVKPVYGPVGLAGWILAGCGRVAGADTAADSVEASQPDVRQERVPGLASDCVVLLDPNEIRFAEASRHVVWLVTDRGRIKAAAKGMDNLERELARYGFLRVHRSFLINPGRVRRVHNKGHGIIALSTSDDRPESIPVSRRSTQKVRQRLGL